MDNDMKTVISRLEDLPEGAQATLATKLNGYLNDLEGIRAKIEESRSSGKPEALTKDQLLKRIHDRHPDIANG